LALNPQSWVESANRLDSDFPLANLPFGVFTHNKEEHHIGIAIGDEVLDLHAVATVGLLAGLSQPVVDACRAAVLNPLMAFGRASSQLLRSRIASLLDAAQAGQVKDRIATLLVPMRDASMQLPARIGDYTDFYASIQHATRVGKLFRPENPLLPNYKHVPIGYHGRASSIVVSGEPIRRPNGQFRVHEAEPVFAPTRSMDYELEIGAFIGAGNPSGQSIPIDQAEEHIFGFCLVNDWSARDIQSWEYQPLGPFLAKSFATTISPWVVPIDSLEPYRVSVAPRPAGDPAPLAYLTSGTSARDAFDVRLEVFLLSNKMRQEGIAPFRISRGNLHDLYWTVGQLVTHHTSNGCNLRPGDLLATGTISGPDEGSEGCLLEMKHRAGSLQLPSGETRTFLEDGDEVTLRAYTQKAGLPRIGFGQCTGRIVASA
jgi:fumarylacetoacetase